MPNIIIDENIPLLGSVFKSFANVTTVNGRKIDRELLIRSNCDALIIRSITKINEKLLDKTGVKFVGTSTSGTDHIDLQYLKTNNIAFAYAPGSNANSVAEYVVYSILMWAKSNCFKLKDKTIGIVGYGNIGRIVATYAKAIGLRVLVNDPPLKDENFIFPDFVNYCTLDELCRQSDIITNHVPLTKNGKYPTWRLFAENELNQLKTGSLFIHTSRGYVVDEKPLLERLAKREIIGVLDVWENEPVVNQQLVKYCFMATPHIAGYAYDGKLKGALMMAEAVEENFNIKVDKEILKKELNSGVRKISVNSNPEVIIENLEHNRRLKNDYIEFLQTMLIEDEKERGAAFDRLRKNYPRRRECLTE